MVVSFLFALAIHPMGMPGGVVSGAQEWEETPSAQAEFRYHPLLRFNPSMTFMFQSPDFVAQGHYSQQGNHYSFRPELAFEVNNTDMDRLTAEMPPEMKQDTKNAYARSLQPFEADYDEANQELALTCIVKGTPATFSLYRYTSGDESLVPTYSNSEAGLAGLWNAPDPFPERLDSKTRYRIGGEEGLQSFWKEAMASDGAQFGLLDLRVDKTFRNHAIIGQWRREGSQLVLTTVIKETRYEISADGRKLMSGGKAAYVRG